MVTKWSETGSAAGVNAPEAGSGLSAAGSQQPLKEPDKQAQADSDRYLPVDTDLRGRSWSARLTDRFLSILIIW